MSPQDRAARSAELEPQTSPGSGFATERTTARYPSGGLISSILGVSSQGDQGALAALRTLPRRAAPDPDYTDPVGVQERNQARVVLLLALAEQSAGPARSRSLTQAAELLFQLGERERAQELYRRALEADPENRLALQELARERVRAGDLVQAQALWRSAGEQARNARELCLALCAQAELAAQSGTDPEAAAALLTRAVRERPQSLLAVLLLARLQLQQGQLPELADTLQIAAEAAAHDDTRGLFLLEAGRVHERLGASDRALRCYEDAQATDGSNLGALLGIVRLRSARGDHAGMALHLAKLSALTSDPLRAEWTRQRGLVLLDALGDAAGASTVLQSLETASGLRLRSRAAEAAGERGEQERALEAWAQASGGALRSLINAEQARGRARAAGTDPAGRPLGEALRRAAQLAAEPNAARDEQQVLSEVAVEDPDYATADVLSFDAAAELGDLAHLSAVLGREAVRWTQALRAGPLLAALDLEVFDLSRPEHSERWDALDQIADGRPLITRYLAARAGTPQQSARLWLQEAVAAKGAHAAFAATMAGRYLEMAGVDATEAYADALDAHRGYLPAALGLEIGARMQGDLGALERVHREIADTTESGAERCARQVRLGLLNADSDLSAAAHWLALAAEESEGDAVLDELSIRLAMDQSPAHRADLLEAAAERQSSAAYARAMLLQAAEAHANAAQWDDAVRIYRQLLNQDPSDAYADCALLAALAQRGRPSALAAELETRARGASTPARRTALLMDWSQAELMQGQTQRAHGLLERVLAEGGGSATVTALRTLQRSALQTRDDTRALHYTLQLSEALEEPGARAAELRLAVRFCRRVGADPTTPLLAAEGKLRELWYARELEALALRTADRARLYEALRMHSVQRMRCGRRRCWSRLHPDALPASSPTRCCARANIRWRSSSWRVYTRRLATALRPLTASSGRRAAASIRAVPRPCTTPPPCCFRTSRTTWSARSRTCC
jgi:tetratricopeptide (TPR) repeat protein